MTPVRIQKWRPVQIELASRKELRAYVVQLQDHIERLYERLADDLVRQEQLHDAHMARQIAVFEDIEATAIREANALAFAQAARDADAEEVVREANALAALARDAAMADIAGDD